MKDINREVAMKLKSARKEKNVTQLELAKKLKITQQSIQAIESGNININLSTLQKICRALHIKLTIELP